MFILSLNVGTGLMVKNPPANAGDTRMCVRSLGQEESLKKELATCSSILAWKVPWTEVTGVYGPWGHKTVRHD